MRAALATVAVAALLGAVCAVPLADGVEVLKSGWGPEPVKQSSGYISVNKQGDNAGHVFYWMFEARSNPDKAPLVMWLTGGPGCSSELAIFEEMGPYRLNSTGGVTSNQFAWNSAANMLYIDQPVGTGFSYADDSSEYVTNETQVGEDMWEFMQTFMQQYPQYKGRDFYITGESYAGHYVPAIAYRIYQGNAELADDEVALNLQGIAIGNGLVDPAVQYLGYAPFAYDNKIINDQQYASLNSSTQSCESAINSGSPLALYLCNSIISTIQQDGGNLNVYDIRKKCTHPPLCYDFSAVDKLMQSADVQQSLGVSSKAQWSECNNQVHQYLTNDWMTNLEQHIPTLLDEAKYRVLVYSGEEDLICNWYGGRMWVSKMQWSGQSGYNGQQFKPWQPAGSSAALGETKTQGLLTFLGVYQAGHMVPKDQPKASLLMLEALLNGTPF